jgi:hypothetical protein
MIIRDKIAIEAPERSRVDAIDVRRAMEMLEEFRTAIPEAFASTHHGGVKDKGDRTA